MPSLRARFANRFVRRRLKPLPLPDIDAPTLRAMTEKTAFRILPKSLKVEAVETPVRGEWHRPAKIVPGRVILYFHGGGYVFGSPRLMSPISCHLAAAAEAPAFSVDYRMAPEYTCPAPIEDALAAFDWLLSQGTRPEEIYVGGDSAGGGIALAMTQALVAAGRPTPGGAFLISPWTDLTASGASIEENDKKDAMFTADTIKRGGSRYAGALALDDPRVSPLFGEFKGLPRLYICASRDEVLRDDGIRAAEKAKAAGASVELHVEDGLVHIWPIFAPIVPESVRTIRQIADFIRRE